MMDIGTVGPSIAHNDLAAAAWADPAGGATEATDRASREENG